LLLELVDLGGQLTMIRAEIQRNVQVRADKGGCGRRKFPLFSRLNNTILKDPLANPFGRPLGFRKTCRQGAFLYFGVRLSGCAAALYFYGVGFVPVHFEEMKVPCGIPRFS
jgi:hypothetical protein